MARPTEGENTIQWCTNGSNTAEGTRMYVATTKYTEPMENFPNIFQGEDYQIGRCAEFNIHWEIRREGCRIGILQPYQPLLFQFQNHMREPR